MITNILNYLMLQKYTTRAQLLAFLKAEGINITDRVLRHTIEKMVTDGHYCIESSEKGYSLIENSKDFEAAISYLDAKAEAIAIRKNCIIRNYNERQTKQLSFL